MNIQETYSRLRGRQCIVGHDAKCALQSAKTITAFRELEAQGRVRIQAEPERENYFDVYGKPEGYTNNQGHEVSAEKEREEICAQIERNGLWVVSTDYLTPEGKWAHAGSVGMCNDANPVSPFENPYVPDLMDEALTALDNAWSEAGEAV